MAEYLHQYAMICVLTQGDTRRRGPARASVGRSVATTGSWAAVRQLLLMERVHDEAPAGPECGDSYGSTQRRPRAAQEGSVAVATRSRSSWCSQSTTGSARACASSTPHQARPAARRGRRPQAGVRGRHACLTPIYFGPNLAGKPAAGGSSGGGGASELRRRAARHVGALPICARWRGGEVRPRDHRRRRTDRPATRDQNCVPEPRSNTTDGRLDAQLMVPRARLAVTRSRAHGRSERARLP